MVVDALHKRATIVDNAWPTRLGGPRHCINRRSLEYWAAERHLMGMSRFNKGYVPMASYIDTTTTSQMTSLWHYIAVDLLRMGDKNIIENDMRLTSSCERRRGM